MGKATEQPESMWTKEYVASLAPDSASIPAAQKVLKKGGFGKVEATADGRGWWVVCQGLTGEYQVTVRRLEEHEREDGEDFEYRCTCPSYKNPCKHALALLLYLVEHPEMRPEAEEAKTAASDFEGLLRAVFANPEEDTPRLVFADFLEENDQPDRAALIRLQCEEARLKPQSARARELRKLIAPIAKKLAKQIEPLPEGLDYEFHRGFIRLEGHLNDLANVNLFPARVMNLFRDGWVESIATYLPFNIYHDLTPLLAQVGELDVSPRALSDEILTSLVGDTAEARTTGRLARLTVHSKNRKALNQMLRAERGDDIDLSAALEPVRNYTYVTQQTFPRLLKFGRFSGARDLSIYSGDALGEEEITALVTTADLSDLRHLRLQGWDLTRGAVEVLTNAPALAKLATLSLTMCGLNPAGVAAIVRSPLFAHLKTLDLPGNTVGKLGVAALLEVDVPSGLKKLRLVDFNIPAADRRKLRKKFGSVIEV